MSKKETEKFAAQNSNILALEAAPVKLNSLEEAATELERPPKAKKDKSEAQDQKIYQAPSSQSKEACWYMRGE